MKGVVLLASLISLAACAAPVGPAESAGSTISAIAVPEGTREIEHAAIPVSERVERLHIDRELTVGEAFGVPFYRISGIALAATGELFVLDAGNHRVVVLDQQANALRQFGRSGPGPGEFQAPVAIAVVGNRIAVYQRMQRRINMFSFAGEHLEDHILERSFGFGEMIGLDDNLLVVNASGTPVPIRPGLATTGRPWVVGVYAPEGDERRRLVETEDLARARYLTGAVAGRFPIAAPHPRAALSAAGIAYATPGDEYEILAMDSSGEARWVIRVAWTPPMVTERHKNEAAAEVLAEIPGDSFVETDWPERFAAIVNLEVDGAANLYVFPYDIDAYFETDISRRPPEAPVPVEVYSPGGERLFAGLSDLPSWDAQRLDRVCRIEIDPESAEEQVACYRLQVRR